MWAHLYRRNKRSRPTDDDYSSDEEFDINEDISSSDNVSDDEDEGSEIEDMWFDVDEDFVPLKRLPTYREPETTIDEGATSTEIFFKLFPRSLFIWIAQCTNQR